MNAVARTPEELELLLEDTLVLRDPRALAELFEAGAVLTCTSSIGLAGEAQAAHGAEAITQLALATWHGPRNYIAAPRQVMQARDLALIVTEHGLNVVRRGDDGAWRYAILRQSVDQDYG